MAHSTEQIKWQKYEPIHKKNQMIYGEGNRLIITGWSDKKYVSKKIESADYLAIGQLYSPTRGINLLIRNLLYNPFIKQIIGVKATRNDKNSGSVQCLHDFFVNGFKAGHSEETGEDVWVIDSDIVGYIDKVIERDDLIKIIHCIQFQMVESIKELQDKLIKDKTIPIEFWGEKKIYPLKTNEPDIIPGQTYVHRVEGRTIADTWVKIIHRIKSVGVIRPTGYDGKWQELINLVSVVTGEPSDLYVPSWVPVSREFLAEYIPQVLEDSPYMEGVKYTYGQRLRSWFGCDQIKQVIEKLIGEVDAASAVMSLWDVKDHVRGGSPCLNHIWFRVVNGEISMTALFRSNDMFSAWVSNAMALRALQMHVIDEINNRTDLDLKIGHLMTISQSAHIYDDCWETAQSIIDKHYHSICVNRNYDDPAGNFMVEWTDKGVLVSQASPSTGEVIRTYNDPKYPLYMLRKICYQNPSIEVEHIAYLGYEIGKCSKMKEEYVQDQN